MRNQLLLIEDVDDLGRSGDIVTVKPGYSRNFLIPQKKAVVADKFTLRLQSRLKEERQKRAVIDRGEAEALAAKIGGMVLTAEVKVDPDGHMYGSVSTQDIARMLVEEGHAVDRRNVLLPHAIKTPGDHTVHLKLKEGVPVQILLRVVPEGYVPPSIEEVQSPPQE